MPPAFWAEALHTATHLLNIRPTKPLDLKTPHESLYHTPPSYDHLRVYGCLCYPNLSTAIPHKLAPRSPPCVFIRYPSEHKGYRCYHIPTKRVYTSRHVTFDEEIFPFSDGSSTRSPAYDFRHNSTNPNPHPDIIARPNPLAISPHRSPSPSVTGSTVA
jgi:histone deacetylase 1/2